MSRLPDDSPSAWLLRVHAELTAGLGRMETGWRRSQLWIGTAGATRAEARHVPPPPEQLPALMQEWEQSLLSERPEAPLVKLSRGLAQLETIHPFLEGNGRMIRLLLQQRLIGAGLLRQPVLLWSQQLQRHRHEARQAMHALRSRNDNVHGRTSSLRRSPRPRTRPSTSSAGSWPCGNNIGSRSSRSSVGQCRRRCVWPMRCWRVH